MEEQKKIEIPPAAIMVETMTFEGKPAPQKREVKIERGVSMSRVCKLLSRSGVPAIPLMTLKREGKVTFEDHIHDGQKLVAFTRSFEITPFPFT